MDRRLEPKHSVEVLRYWGALLRHQEALSARPRARPNLPEGELRAVNLLEPASGQDYMKLPFAGAESFLAERKGSVQLELRAERVGFFEDWLAMRYRPSEEGEGQVAHLVLFPAVHLPRGELAGLLRFPADVSWLAGEKAFVPPTAAERGQRTLPDPPTHLRVAQPGKDPEQALPFFVDTRLLRETLHVGAEELDEFFAGVRAVKELTAREMVGRLCGLLEGTAAGAEAEAGAGAGAEAEAGAAAGAGAGAVELLGRLFGAVQRRLLGARSRSRVFPVALVVNGDRARATWHVQRDIGLAIEELEAGELKAEAPLLAYLRGESPAARARVGLGRWPRAPLTQSQRGALELALGSGFCAIQGPPGSGKTSLILNASVHQLIEKVRILADQGVMGESVLLVTSTNNRAVDNVIDPLCAEELSDYPLALRVGSREITEQITPRTLERTLSWLSRQPATPPTGELDLAKKTFLARATQVDDLVAGARKAHAAEAELRRLRAEPDPAGAPSIDATMVSMLTLLSALSGKPADPAKPADANGLELAPWQRAPGKAQTELNQLIAALEKLSEDCESEVTAKRVVKSFERIRKGKLAKAGAALGIELALGLPPVAPPETSIAELWEEAIERALERLRDLDQALTQVIEAPARSAVHQHRESRIASLTAQLAEAGDVHAEDTAELRQAHVELYRAALELRAAWMRENRGALEKSLQLAVTQCRRLRSLKALLDAPRGAGAWLRQLFPVFGCTLLSLGNAFAADPSSCARVIVDEAGQCHAAYAVSALLRAPSALILGDVHQLEPVVGLTLDDERRIRRGLRLGISDQELAPYRMYDDSGNSAQSLADRALPERPTLRDHFRCQPPIIALCEAWCSYGMVVRTPARSRRDQVPELDAAVLFAPTVGEQEASAGSWVNASEVDELVAWVSRLIACGIAPADIGVITPFRAQSEALQRALRAARVPLETARDDVSDENLSLFASTGGGLALGTVHRFQGGERSIMLFSTTVTRTGSLRFLDERVNLLNVAASRAKEHLIVIGHEGTLAAGRHTRVLIR